jgi:hypothetical protein
MPQELRPEVIPIPYQNFFENYTYLWNHFANFNQTLPKCSWVILFQTIKSSLQVGGGVWPPGAWAIRYLICLVTLIINIYGLGVGISTIKKFTSGRGWGMTTRGLSYMVFNLPSHPDHKYRWFRGGNRFSWELHISLKPFCQC